MVSNRGLEQIERGVVVVQIEDQRAGEVVAHVHVVRIEQQRALGPFLRALGLAQRGERADAEAHRRAVVGLLRDDLLARARARARAARRAPSLSPTAL